MAGDREEETEAVHDLRVATRRLRAALRTFRRVLPRRLRRLRRDLRTLARGLGRVRDLDVLLEGLPEQARGLRRKAAGEATGFLRALRGEREAAWRRLERHLEGRGAARLRARLRALAAGRAPGRFPDAARAPIGRAAARLVSRPIRRALRLGRGAGPDSPAGDLHAVRIAVKRARYALEPFGDLAGRPAAATIRAAVAVQDLLGEHQDAVVAAGAARRFSRDLAPLAGAYERKAARLRGAFPAAWRRLDVPRRLAAALAPLGGAGGQA